MKGLVYVPIFGLTHGDVPENHDDLWGFCTPGDQLVIDVVHYSGSQYTDTPVEIMMRQQFNIFESEWHHMREIADDEQLPDEVVLALAKLALLPVSRSN